MCFPLIASEKPFEGQAITTKTSNTSPIFMRHYQSSKWQFNLASLAAKRKHEICKTAGQAKVQTS